MSQNTQQQRIEDLKSYRDGWKDAEQRAVAERQRLADLKAMGVRVEDTQGNDILQKQMEAQDVMAREAQKAVIRVEAALGQAEADAH
ncbi:hypothetical protein D9M68_766450 [compost metagenome]